VGDEYAQKQITACRTPCRREVGKTKGHISFEQREKGRAGTRKDT